MRHQLQRGTAEQTQSLILPEGQMSAVTDLKQLRVHDGVTEGGINPFGGLALKGPKEISAGEPATYTIVNYSRLAEYNVEVSDGEVDIGDGSITLTPTGNKEKNSLIIIKDGTPHYFEINVTIPGLRGIYSEVTTGATPRLSFGMTAIDSKIYIFGGYDGSIRRDDLWEYDLPTNQFRQLPTMPPGRYGGSAVSYSNRVYIFGGRLTNPYQDDLWVYDPQTEIWEQLASAPNQITSHSAVVIGTKMYVFGGVSVYLDTSGTSNMWRSTRHNDILVYDFETDAWQQIPTTVPTRNAHSAVVINDKMYIFGGVGDQGFLDDLWEYDPAANAWQQLSSFITPRINHSAIALYSKMYVFGGQDTNGRLNDLWEYAPENNQWTQLNSGSTIRIGHSAVAIDGRMYIFGGRDDDLNYINDLWVIE